jgi:hypothetical protein
MPAFYTYLWLREDGTVRYVGKGNGRRAVRKGSPADLSLILIQEHESEADAFAAERFLIAYYGRWDTGKGRLSNRTDGGQGPSGRPMQESTKRILQSPEVKERKRLSQIGHLTPQVTRDRIAAGNKGKIVSAHTKILIKAARTKQVINGNAIGSGLKRAYAEGRRTPMTQEQKDRMAAMSSMAAKARWAKEERVS